MLIAEIRDASSRCWARSCFVIRTLRPGQGYFGLAKIPGRPKAPAGQVQAVIIGSKAAAKSTPAKTTAGAPAASEAAAAKGE